MMATIRRNKAAIFVLVQAIIILDAFSFGFTSRFLRFFSSQSYQNRRVGFPLSLLVSLFVDLEQLQEAEDRLCNLNNEELLKWRESYVARLNIIPIAVSALGNLHQSKISS